MTRGSLAAGARGLYAGPRDRAEGEDCATTAMAQSGAHALGLDISERSLEIARRYHESIREEVSGQAEYRVADLNTLELPAETYDVIAVIGALHHLVRVDHVIAEVHRALKPGGLLWVSDSQGDEGLPAVLVAGALALVLPTQVSYRDKVRGLLRYGWNAPSRVRASIQAEGLSPFEGAGRARGWVQLISKRFVIEKRVSAPAVTGYLAHQLTLPDRVAVPLLRAVCTVDRLFVRLRFLRSTGITLYARKGAGRDS